MYSSRNLAYWWSQSPLVAWFAAILGVSSCQFRAFFCEHVGDPGSDCHIERKQFGVKNRYRCY